VQCNGDAYVNGDDHHSVGASMHAWRAHIIVEGEIHHPLTAKPVLDEMGFVASQHLDSERDKFHLHDFSHNSEEVLDTSKHPSGGLSNLLLKTADILELTDDLPDVIPVAKRKNATRRRQLKSSSHDEEYCRRPQSEGDNGDKDVVQSKIKFSSLKEQSLFYDDIIYALLRMRPLSISCAECSVAMSCGKVDFDKYG
jgi:hypothetical protein